jgi:glutamate/tyrosine decarboxylase-like PLP-dependent enzyme
MRTLAETREASLEMSPDQFRTLGHQLVDRVADFLEHLPSGPLTWGESPRAIRALLGNRGLPPHGAAPAELLEEAATLLFDHSLFNGHPRFWGYVSSSPAPIGILSELLSAAVNPNVGAWVLSPVASEIEAQAVRWMAELINFPTTCGGLLVSGGNMANFIGFLAARRAKASWDLRATGVRGSEKPLTAYASTECHTWIKKAADLFGLGTEAIRWIPVNESQRMNMPVLEKQIAADRADGLLPFLVIGAAGTVSTGAIDPLPQIAAVCRREGLWFHVDGAYGAPAAALPEASADLKGIAEADSVALDPHKWLYSPLEAGCTLVRDPSHLHDAFSFAASYYQFEGSDDDPRLNYYEIGPQNSRGFRALKVWLGLRQAGREGQIAMIRDDIALSKAMFEAVRGNAELEAMTQGLSITTFRFVPKGLPRMSPAVEEYLNELNRELVDRLQGGGELFVSNAMVGERYVLRACIVNFRTTMKDVLAVPEIVVRVGRELDQRKRPPALGGRK